MAAISWADAVGFAPQLSAITSTQTQSDIIAFANAELNPSVIGGSAGEAAPRLRMARIFLACHEGTMQLRRGIGGALTGEDIKADGVSLSYAAPWHGAIDSYETTAYGQELLKIISTSPGARFVIPS